MASLSAEKLGSLELILPMTLKFNPQLHNTYGKPVGLMQFHSHPETNEVESRNAFNETSQKLVTDWTTTSQRDIGDFQLKRFRDSERGWKELLSKKNPRADGVSIRKTDQFMVRYFLRDVGMYLDTQRITGSQIFGDWEHLQSEGREVTGLSIELCPIQNLATHYDAFSRLE